MKKTISLILALAMLCSLLPGLSVPAHGAEASGTYTYDMYIVNPLEDWSPLSWTTVDKGFIQNHIQTPLVDISIKNSATGEFQWVYLAAKSITDVTDQVAGAEGSVFEIALNPDLCWDDGTPINADTYIYSMQTILDRDRYYGRASDFTEGNMALAGADAYMSSGQMIMEHNETTNIVQSENDLVLGNDGNYYDPAGNLLYVLFAAPLDWLGGNTLKYYVETYGEEYFDTAAYAQLEAMQNIVGMITLNPESLRLLQQVISKPSWGEGPEYFTYYIGSYVQYPQVDWDVVGLKKVDDYTIRYSCTRYFYLFDFQDALCGTNWLIHEEIYEACKEAGTYCTSPETTPSYGPYKLQSADDTKTVLVRNEKHYEYTTDAGGNLSSMTSFKVDGSYQPQWQMDSIVAHVLSAEEAEQRFLAGELDIWSPTVASVAPYIGSPALYRNPHATTYSFIFNANPDVLKEMDASYGTTNAVVLSNYNFRKAFSLALDRANMDFAGAGRVGALSLLNEAFYYDAANNPNSVYRKSAPAMQAICDLYDVTYGPGTPYATLEEAYASIDGYEPEQAKALMAQACEELVAAGLYTKGEPIVLTYAASSVSDFINRTMEAVSATFNEAAQGSGFGTITVVPRESGFNWSTELKQGKATMVLGGWVGNVLNPFGAIDLYTNPLYHYVPLNVNTAAEDLTLNISGKDYTMSWEKWGKAINGGSLELHHNVEALAKLEGAILEQMYYIPAVSDATNTMLGYQVSYYTREHSVLYGFGGTRLMKFNYTDEAWAAYVASGKLDYTQGSQDPCQDGHAYETVITDPTCTEDGYTTYTCSVCGDSYVADYVDALGHNYKDGICTRCGAEDPDYVAVIATGWSGDTQWTLTEDGLLTIYGKGNMKNYTNKSQMPWYSLMDQITDVVIEEGVTRIGSYAFYGMAIKSVKIADSVTIIGDYAFKGAEKLVTVEMPKSMSKIGEAAFYGCTSLKEITVPEGIYTIWAYTFKGCTALTKVKLPKTLLKIDQGAFENCTALPYIFMPTNVEIIGAWSFKGCTGLKEADMQWTDATEIREGAFKNCSRLATIYLPANIQILRDSCFYGIGAEQLAIPATVTKIEAWCFARAGLKSITFEGNAPSIGEGAFNKVTMIAYYPTGNATWTTAVMQNYGGTVTWKAN